MENLLIPRQTGMLQLLAGHYNEQNPYANRDPRLATDIITNQSPCQNWTNNQAQIWYSVSGGTVTYSELLNQSYLGITKDRILYEKILVGQQYKEPGYRISLPIHYAVLQNCILIMQKLPTRLTDPMLLLRVQH